MHSASSSTTSLASTATVSSRAPLTQTTRAQPKDFQAAFASLQSTYGFGAAVPSPGHKTAAPPSAPRSSATVSPRQAPAAGQPKDFEAAFASLQSTYGSAAVAPGPVQRPQEQGDKSNSLFSKLVRPRASSQKAKSSTLA